MRQLLSTVQAAGNEYGTSPSRVWFRPSVLLTTLAMGNVLNAGFDQVFNMYNQLVIETGDIIDTYVYRVGITNMQFSLATAAGLFKSVVSFVLVVTSYVCAYKFADYKIF